MSSDRKAERIQYHLRWWSGHGPDWSDWWTEGDSPSCLCGYNGTPEECEASRSVVADQEPQATEEYQAKVRAMQAQRQALKETR